MLKSTQTKMLTPNEVRVIKALLKYSKPTAKENCHQCNLRKAYLSLKMSRYSFSGSISALRKKGLYNYVVWETNPNKKGYKDYPAKKVPVLYKRSYVGYYKVRSDIALVFFNKNYLDRVMIERVG